MALIAFSYEPGAVPAEVEGTAEEIRRAIDEGHVRFTATNGLPVVVTGPVEVVDDIDELDKL